MRQYFQKHKYHLIALFVLLITVGVSWYVDFKTQNTNNVTQDKSYKIQDTNKIQTPNSNNQTTTDRLQDTGYKLHVTSSETQITDSDTLPDFAKATPGKQVISYKLQVTTTSNVYDAMQSAKLDFKTKTFSGLGEFVEEIGGLKNDPQGGKYWIYFINGESAKLGISTQIVKPNDLIEWNYGNID